MDSITLGRMQSYKFLLKAIYEMLDEIKMHNDLDYYSERHFNTEIMGAKSNITCAIQTLENGIKHVEYGIKHATEPDAD